MDRNQERLSVLKKYGWSKNSQSSFFKAVHQIIGDNFKGTFTIKKVNGNWFWYYKFSSHKIHPRTKYLCSCEVKTNMKESSFEHATQIFLEKINHNFSNKDVIEPNLSKYIDEYIEKCMVEGGLVYENRKRGKRNYNALVFNGYTDKTIQRNTSTMKRHIGSLKEFKMFCTEKKIKTIFVNRDEDFRVLINEYFNTLLNRNKRGIDGDISPHSDKHLSRLTIKIKLQSIRTFLSWLSTSKSEGGRGLLKKSHNITSDYQNYLLAKSFGNQQPTDEFIDFTLSNYEKCVNDCISYIQEVWRLYCKTGGDREHFRRERLSYNEKLHDGTCSGVKHMNQPRNLIVMSDVVYFVSYLQLRYGFRITEILQSFRNKDFHDEYFIPTKVSSFFHKVEEEDFHYYNLDIRNSKKKHRLVPIDDLIWSWDAPPKGVPYTTSKYENNSNRYETNIVDVIFEIFYPNNHPKSFPSPNLSTKSNKGYSNTYYLNLFKEKLVLHEDYEWKDRGVNSTHHLRSFFVSYMLRKDELKWTEVAEITGHNPLTMMKYYDRINTEGKRKTLQKNNIRSILSKKITN